MRALVLSVISLLFSFAFGAEPDTGRAVSDHSSGLTLDFVDAPVQEVARSLSVAYDTPIMVDAAVERRVTFHLEGVSLLEGLSALCESNGLELVQKENLLVIRLRKHQEQYPISGYLGFCTGLRKRCP